MDIKELIGKRIRAEREKRGISQQKLAETVGWSTHQITLNVESGQREIKAWELARIAKLFGVYIGELLEEPETEKPLTYVLWRDKTIVVDPVVVESKFRKRCADYAYVERMMGIDQKTSGCLPISDIDLEKADFPMIHRMAKDTRDKLTLGDYPAHSMVKTLEEKYGVKFFCEDLVGDGSAASSRSEDYGCAAMISSQEPAWRQNFSIAHELFHLITWSETLFAGIEKEPRLKEKNEKLANAFAAALLIPEEVLRDEWFRMRGSSALPNFVHIVTLARNFQVSLDALLYHLANLNYINHKIREKFLTNKDILEYDRKTKTAVKDQTSRLSERLVRLVFSAYQETKISRARSAEILDVPLRQLPLLLEQYGYKDYMIDETQASYS